MLATFIAASAGVDVRGPADCPSAQGISERLAPLLPAGADTDEPRDLALVDVIERRPDGNTDLVIRLLRSDASEVGNRRVSLGGTCQDLAEAVAAILAAWKADLRSAAELSGEPVAAPARDEPGNQVLSVEAAKVPGWNVLLGAGAGAALLGGVAASGTIEAVAGKQDSRWHLRVGASAQSARTLNLSTGHADWRHTSFAMSLLWRTRGPVWRLSVDAGPVLGWASLSGTGFSPNRQSRVFEYGVAAGLRVGRTWGRWTLWAETRATLWLVDRQATAKNGAGSVVEREDLPLLDAAASLGLSLALFP